MIHLSDIQFNHVRPTEILCERVQALSKAMHQDNDLEKSLQLTLDLEAGISALHNELWLIKLQKDRKP